MLQLQFDDSLSFQVIHNWNGLQIFRLNTDSPEIFINEFKNFIKEVPQYVDEKGQLKIIYVIEKMPPLSAILKLAESPMEDDVVWAPSVIIKPADTEIFNKFIPVVLWGINLTIDKKNYSINIFDNSYKDNLDEVVKWLDSQIALNPHTVKG